MVQPRHSYSFWNSTRYEKKKYYAKEAGKEGGRDPLLPTKGGRNPSQWGYAYTGGYVLLGARVWISLVTIWLGLREQCRS